MAKVQSDEHVRDGCDLPVLVVGLGKTGVSCIRYLRQQGKTVRAVDSRSQPPGLDEVRAKFPEVEISLGDFRQEDFDNISEIVISPGVSLATPAIKAARDKGVPCFGDIEIFVRQAKAPVIAITGSNGKSTVASLVAEMLQADIIDVELGGNIGTPALELLDKQVPQFYVLELSSFQLETTDSLHAHAAVVLNISPDHMDRYASLEDYAGAKLRIFNNAGYQLINCDDPALAGLRQNTDTIGAYGLQCTDCDFTVVDLQGRQWLKVKSELWMPCDEMKLAGMHNVSNALAAIALALTAGASREGIINTLKRYPGLPHRTQWVTEQNSVSWYNDSKGTNVGATVAAVEGMGRPVVLIAGGQGKGADFSELAPVVREHARAVVLIGEDAALIERALNGCVQMAHADSLDDAVAKAAAFAQPGDAVLLSPACASFDMFSSFEDRGEQFMAAVRRFTA